ncbi:ACH96202.1 Ac68-like protein [Kallithea virus]|uniref:ACH96202.1 Ac68-like protein n=1 Tax=Kallithea virus TaxID=1654582 RepID=A0A0F7KMX2_9VIRU|nr:ACH96202.1 Ac68-like protein [Kallithea virus]AKH40379.1 putative Ac68-like protein [Kallithea virus]AQN78601.1 ACH96202.1 Ac68-like protein [Kallithea virus]
MKLSQTEFKLIRPLEWSLINHGEKVYNTTLDETQTRLFWLDFMRLIFAPRFKKQYGVTRIENFDDTQPVLLTDDLELLLPTQIETVCYFADNMDSPPMRFALPFNSITIIIITFILFACVLFVDVFFGNKIKFIRNVI